MTQRARTMGLAVLGAVIVASVACGKTSADPPPDGGTTIGVWFVAVTDLAIASIPGAVLSGTSTEWSGSQKTTSSFHSLVGL